MKTIGRLQSATIFWLGFLCTASTLVSANPPSTMSDPVTNMSICQEKAEARRGDERKQFLRECLRTTYAERMTDVDRMRQAQSGDGPKEFVDAVINNVARAWTSFRISLSSHQPYNLQMKNCINFVAHLCLGFALIGCTTYVSNEKKIGDYKTPVTSLVITFVENKNLTGTLKTLTQQGVQIKDWSKLEGQARRDIPQMLAFAQIGTTRFLKPLLVDRKLSIENDVNKVPTGGNLAIKPKRYEVECGAGSLICQTSIVFEVWLVDYRQNSIVWSADFKVGAPMGAPQSEVVFENFYKSVVDRLAAAKVIF